MNLKCFFGSHEYKGCRCDKCGRTRDEGHDWSADCEKCTRCGKIRPERHNWSADCEKCSICGMRRLAEHVWGDFVCTTCLQHHPRLLALTAEVPASACAFARLCFPLDDDEYGDVFRGARDTRDWMAVPALTELVRVAYRDPAKAWGILNALGPEYSDFHFVHGWRIELHAQAGAIDECRRAFREGLIVSVEKWSLCGSLANAELKSGSFENSLRWWIACGAGQLADMSYRNLSVYIHLSAIADLLSLQALSQKLIGFAHARGEKLFVAGEASERYRARLDDIRDRRGAGGIDGLVKAITKLGARIPEEEAL